MNILVSGGHNLSSVLFIGTHTDDLELGAVSAMYKHKKLGDEIYYIIVADCTDLYPGLLSESLNCVNDIQPDHVLYMNLPNRKLAETSCKEQMRQFFEMLRPDINIVYGPHIHDLHQDHASVAEEIQRVFRHHTLIEYAVVYSSPHFTPNYFIPMTNDIVKKKLKLVSNFKSQSGKLYLTDDFLLAQLRFRGAQIGMEFAEGFNIVRWVDDI